MFYINKDTNNIFKILKAYKHNPQNVKRKKSLIQNVKRKKSLMQNCFANQNTTHKKLF